MQEKINEIQQLYRQWLALQPKLEAAQEEWRHSMQIMQTIKDFYERDYLHYYEQIEKQDVNVSLATEGEYSIMSEDAIFDAIGEQHSLAWDWIRLGMQVVDPKD
ncbi:hypothetical protein V757_03005 [Pelistega indica]|uniref:DUF4298 domain-containing protein n=1 Tax=Pelistega indica TaxID=1414851 RepID=V8G944_9BURK|nr:MULTISPECIES: DUF4298 domain-containing protein [Pelistega]ETD72626.1 hypothetical protein V757_03005 [Pelistega indica]